MGIGTVDWYQRWDGGNSWKSRPVDATLFV
jgi:hypothetical protein